MQNLKSQRKDKKAHFLKRKVRINSKIKSNNPDFRVIVNKSNKYIKAQVIDNQWNVVCFITDKKAKGENKTQRAETAWVELGKLMAKKSVAKAAFDRNGNLYHGRVKALADWIRKSWIAL